MDIRYFAVAMLALGVSTAVQAGKIQCWKDKDGNRMCGDRVPPEYAGQRRDVIEDGRVVETKRAAKTAEELAAEEKAAEEAEEARRRAEYDRALLESYRNLQDIETMRDERIAMLEMRIRSAEKSATESQKTLESLRARLEKEDKPGPKARLEKQIDEYEKTVDDSNKAVERLTEQRDQTRAKYEADAKRYKELRPPPPPKTETPDGQAKSAN